MIHHNVLQEEMVIDITAVDSDIFNNVFHKYTQIWIFIGVLIYIDR